MNFTRAVHVLSAALTFIVAPLSSGQELIPLHPVIGDVEAVSSGDFGESYIDLVYQGPSGSQAINSFEGCVRLQFYDVQGATLGGEVIVRSADIRTLQTVSNTWQPWPQPGTGTPAPFIGPDTIFQLRVGSYIRDAGPLAYCFEVRGYSLPTSPQPIARTHPDSDGLPAGNGSDELDRRYQIVRERGTLLSASLEVSDSAIGVLRLTFSSPVAGPHHQVPAPLRVPPVFVPLISFPISLESSVDSDPFELLPSAFQINGGGGFVSLDDRDVSSISIVPGSNQAIMLFDQKISRLTNGAVWSIRLSPNAPVRDAWGQRFRTNFVGVTPPVVCQGIPGPFALFAPVNNSIALRTPVQFEWTEPSCTIGPTVGEYRIELSTDSSFDTIAYSTPAGGIGSISIDSNVLSPASLYWWRVTAIGTQGETLAFNGPFRFATAVPGDTNGDGRVDGADLSVLLGNFGATAVFP